MPESLEQHKLTLTDLEAEQERLSQLIDKVRQDQEQAVNLVQADEDKNQIDTEKNRIQTGKPEQADDFPGLEQAAQVIITPEYLKNSKLVSEDKVDQLNEMIDLIPKNGLGRVVVEIEKMKDPLILDAFHDILTSSRLYEDLVAGGYIKPARSSGGNFVYIILIITLSVLLVLFLLFLLI
ncbi:MAG: hypothetical protein ACOCU8_02655 [Patescibacteria group bacterium]